MMIACAMDLFPSSSIAGFLADAPTRTRMNDEAALRDKLRKIEALFFGAGTAVRKPPPAAAERIRARLREEEKREKSIEIRFSLPDPWSRQMFIALCRRSIPRSPSISPKSPTG
jgi:hypothetical protein